MCAWEINGNLIGPDGFSQREYAMFRRSLNAVYQEYALLFGRDILLRYPLFVDNAIHGSGYTPITIPVLKRFVVVKLHVLGGRGFGSDENYNACTVYQFAHELGHFLFYCWQGIGKSLADDEEEMLCTAMSFCVLDKYCHDVVPEFLSYCKKTRYKSGAEFVERFGFDLNTVANLMKKRANVV